MARNCGHCGTGPLVSDGSRYCSLACRREAAALGDEDANEELCGDQLVAGCICGRCIVSPPICVPPES